jgi:hypothetical protein
LGDLGGGGATKRVGNLTVLSEREEWLWGRGADSMRVMWGRGRVARSVGGMSLGWQAIRTWRRWVFIV